MKKSMAVVCAILPLFLILTLAGCNLQQNPAERLPEHENSGSTDDSPYQTFVNDNGEVCITGYNGKNDGETLTIPDEIYDAEQDEFMTVTAIGEKAFADNVNGNTEIKEIIIPKTVKYIGKYAFCNNEYLTSVTFEEGSNLIDIGEGAFSFIPNITTFSIPDGVIGIGEYAFERSGIVQFDTGKNKNFSWDENSGLLINNDVTNPNCKTAIYASPYKSDFVIPADVKILSARLFSGYENLRTVDLNMTESIGPKAFENSGLTTIIGGDSVGNASIEAFYGTPWYAEIGSERIIMGTVFLKAGINESNAVIPEGITDVGAEAFKGSNVETVTLPSTVNCIANEAFADCKNLQWVLINAMQPPMTGINCFDESTVIYVKSMVYSMYYDSIFFISLRENISRKQVNVTFYNEDGDYMGETSQPYYASFVNYILEEPAGKAFAYWIDSYGNTVYPDSLFNYVDDVTMTAYYTINYS